MKMMIMMMMMMMMTMLSKRAINVIIKHSVMKSRLFFKNKIKTKTLVLRPRPRLHDPRPRLSFSSSRRLENKTLVSRTTHFLL